MAEDIETTFCSILYEFYTMDRDLSTKIHDLENFFADSNSIEAAFYNPLIHKVLYKPRFCNSKICLPSHLQDFRPRGMQKHSRGIVLEILCISQGKKAEGAGMPRLSRNLG
jgi:hypothetical protein